MSSDNDFLIQKESEALKSGRSKEVKAAAGVGG